MGEGSSPGIHRRHREPDPRRGLRMRGPGPRDRFRMPVWWRPAIRGGPGHLLLLVVGGPGGSSASADDHPVRERAEDGGAGSVGTCWHGPRAVVGGSDRAFGSAACRPEPMPVMGPHRGRGGADDARWPRLSRQCDCRRWGSSGVTQCIQPSSGTCQDRACRAVAGATERGCPVVIHQSARLRQLAGAVPWSTLPSMSRCGPGRNTTARPCRMRSSRAASSSQGPEAGASGSSGGAALRSTPAVRAMTCLLVSTFRGARLCIGRWNA